MNSPAQTHRIVNRRMPLWLAVALLLLAATILGATVLREPIAQAAQLVDSNIVGPLDGNGNIKVHEQGTALVHERGTAAVDVINSSIPIQQAGTPVAIRLTWPDGDRDYTVPMGKRLVIDYVNGFSDVTPTAVLVLSGGGAVLQVFRFLGATAFTNPSGEVLRVISEPVLIQAGPGQRLHIGDGDLELSGYIVDA
jgi:hypothetical protein